MIGRILSSAETRSRPESGVARAQMERIVDLVHNFSFETVPVAAPEIASLGAHLRPGTRVYVGWPQSRSVDAVVDTAARIRQLGGLPVPHVAARSIAGRDHLADLLRRLTAVADVDRVLVVGGGRGSPAGEYYCALQLLETGLFEEFGIRRIGIAGYPEGHPEIAPKELMEALRQKIDYGRRTGTDMYVVTQFGFDANAVIDWVEEFHRSAGDIPVHVGIPGPASLTSLVKYARICGIGCSVRFLTRGATSVLKLAGTWAPDKFLTALAHYRGANPPSGIEALHFFSFGGAARTARWLAAVSDGKFTLHRDGRGFTVPDNPRSVA